MRALLLKYWDGLRSSFWFVPSLMAGAALAVAYATVALDEAVTEVVLQEIGWAYTGGAEGASSVLATIAGSMISIAGVVFSMTLVVLSLASSQLGPRLLRNFMRDTTTQLVLGTFVATFVYCLMVLRTIRRADEGAFVPHVSVSLGVLLSLASVGVLIYFIHHVSVSIQADHIVARVGQELIEGIERLFPRQLGERAAGAGVDSRDVGLPAGFDRESRPALALGDGYLQFVDIGALLALADEQDVLMRIERRPGHYIVCGRPLLKVWPGERCTDAFESRINAAFTLGSHRTATQDVEFPVEQLVEIAVRALSPGINDPLTAVACVDRLGSALCRLAERDLPSAYRLNGEGRLRVVTVPDSFRGILDAAFNPLRQYARAHASVTLRLLETIAVIASRVRRPADRVALRRHADMILRGAASALPEDEDRRAVDERHRAATVALREP